MCHEAGKKLYELDHRRFCTTLGGKEKTGSKGVW